MGQAEGHVRQAERSCRCCHSASRRRRQRAQAVGGTWRRSALETQGQWQVDDGYHRHYRHHEYTYIYTHTAHTNHTPTTHTNHSQREREAGTGTGTEAEVEAEVEAEAEAEAEAPLFADCSLPTIELPGTRVPSWRSNVSSRRQRPTPPPLRQTTQLAPLSGCG